MISKLCNFATTLVILNFLFSITLKGNENSISFLRFLPFISYVVNLLVASVVYLTNRYYHSNLSKLLVVYALFIFFVAVFIPNNDYTRIMNFLMPTYWITSYFIVSHLCYVERSGYIAQKRVEKCFFLISLFVVISILTSRNSFIKDILTGVNVVFYALLYIPWIVTFPNKSKKLVAIVCLIIISIMSIKRSAIIILIGALLIMVFDRGGGVMVKLKRILISALVVVVLLLLYTPNSPIADVITRFEYLEEDGGNGRVDIYEDVCDAFKNQSMLNKVFGSGFRAVQNTLFSQYGYSGYISAHNDFLEVLYDYGWIGFFLYIFLHLLLIHRCIILFKQRSSLFIPYAISYYTFLVMSLVSHLMIYPSYFLILVAFWAYAECKVCKL